MHESLRSGLRFLTLKKKLVTITDWILPSLITIIIISLFLLLERSGLITIGNQDNAAINYSFALMTGLIASISSCFAVVGSLVIAFGEIYTPLEKDSKYKRLIRPNVLFHAGRLAAFFFLGGFLGALGGELSLSGRVVGILNILIAGIMILLGLSITGLIPSINAFGIQLPLFLTTPFERLKKSSHAHAPILLGISTFFLPCGFAQSMQIFALGSGAFSKGGMYMLIFALGTLPVLFIAGVTASYARTSGLGVLKRTGALLVIVFGIYTMKAGLSVIGFTGDLINSPTEESNPATTNTSLVPDFSKYSTTSEKNGGALKSDIQAAIQENYQTVRMHVLYSGFSPEVIRVKQGIPVRWEIYGTEVSGCTNAMIFPYINKRFPVKRNNITTIEFTPQSKGELPFSCWMGMVRGKFIVE